MGDDRPNDAGELHEAVHALRMRVERGELQDMHLRLAAFAGHEPAVLALHALTGRAPDVADGGEASAGPPSELDPMAVDALLDAASALDPGTTCRALAGVTVEMILLRVEALGQELPSQTASLRDMRDDAAEARSAALQALVACSEGRPDLTELVGLAGRVSYGTADGRLGVVREAFQTAAAWLSNPGDALLPVLRAALASEALGQRVEAQKRLKVRYPMRTRTGADNTYASDPGGVRLSLERLRELCPELRPPGLLAELWRRATNGTTRDDVDSWETFCREQLLHGDSRAAVVVQVSPLIVACYTDELDCVALLRFDAQFGAWIGARDGQRLLTVNRYRYLDEGFAEDLWNGEQSLKRYGNFTPLVADLLSLDADRIAARKDEIGEEEWRRCEALGRRLRRSKQMCRDGRPWLCRQPRGSLLVPVEELHRIARGEA